NPNFFVVAETKNPSVFLYTLRPLGFSTPRTSDLSKACHLVDFVYNLITPLLVGLLLFTNKKEDKFRIERNY
ncbi:MAG: hypothetical protein MJA82_18860, partial [Clostridia bacterium]|nr:hypothetical protein [Clostridia bacterium]